MALTAEKLSELLSEESAESYLLWRKARRIGRPIIISLLGSSGVGKSTLATRLALRLGINRVVTTDAIREVLRTVIPVSVLPELHVSSYEAIEIDLKEAQASTYHRQARAVASASAAVAKRYVREKRNVLFEGVHLLPGYMTEQLNGMGEQPIVVEILLALGDRELHNSRLSHRLVTEPGRDGTRHIKRFDVIRNLQDTMQNLSRKAGIREFDVGSDEDLTQKIVKEIVEQALA
jgi:2-phosphoglycerate kinase